jgi:hypothetical protein
MQSLNKLSIQNNDRGDGHSSGGDAWKWTEDAFGGCLLLGLSTRALFLIPLSQGVVMLEPFGQCRLFSDKE